MAKIRAFLDANILFTAAHNPEGLAASLISRQEKLKIRLRTSPYALDEALYNLQHKFPQSVSQMRIIAAEIDIVRPEIRENYNPLHLPENDIPIFQAALLSGSTHLLTGDKKGFSRWFNRPEKTLGVKVQTVRQFVDELLGS